MKEITWVMSQIVISELDIDFLEIGHNKNYNQVFISFDLFVQVLTWSLLVFFTIIYLNQ